MTFVPSEDSDQAGHLPSLISLCCLLLRMVKDLRVFMRTAKTPIRQGGVSFSSSLGLVGTCNKEVLG